MTKPLVIYVDVDETFVRNYGVKRIAMPNVIKHIKELKNQGAIIYCWSSGGSDYAKKVQWNSELMIVLKVSFQSQKSQ